MGVHCVIGGGYALGRWRSYPRCARPWWKIQLKTLHSYEGVQWAQYLKDSLGSSTYNLRRGRSRTYARACTTTQHVDLALPECTGLAAIGLRPKELALPLINFMLSGTITALCAHTRSEFARMTYSAAIEALQNSGEVGGAGLCRSCARACAGVGAYCGRHRCVPFSVCCICADVVYQAFRYPVDWGIDLKFEHEQWLARTVGSARVSDPVSSHLGC